MSLDKTQVARPNASVVFGGAEGIQTTPEYITVTIQVNSFPRADVRYHDKGESNKARSVVPEDLSAKLAADQSKMFEAAPTASIYMEDGLGGTLSFSGYQTNTAYELTPGGMGYAASAIHASAVLDTLQTSVYKNANLGFRDVAGLVEGSYKYTDWMDKVLDKLISNWETSQLNDNLDALTKAVAARAAENNAEGLRAWKSVLSASEDTNEHLLKLKDVFTFKKSLNTAISTMYFNAYGSFLQTMQQFGLQFQMLYVPDTADGNGKYISIKNILQPNLTKNAHITRMFLSAGAKSVLPVTQVMVQGLPGDSWRFPTPDRSKFLDAPGVSVFPADVTSGRVYVVNAPGWLDLGSVVPTRDIPADGTSAPDPAAYVDKRTLQDTRYRKNLDNIVKAVVDDWAKNVYVDMALADSTAQLTVPLDLTWEVGKTYQVTTEGAKGQGNKSLFTGFLAGMVHTLSSTHNAPQAYTTLMFTYVQGEGFTLPGLE